MVVKLVIEKQTALNWSSLSQKSIVGQMSAVYVNIFFASYSGAMRSRVSSILFSYLNLRNPSRASETWEALGQWA